MKRLFVILIMLLFAGALFADRVILRDSTVINGQIIQVTNKGVEIDPDGDTPFDLITRDRIAKIVYDDGREVQFAFDKLYLFEGKYIEGKIKQVNPTEVVYTPKDSAQAVTVPREKVQTIYFADGREISLEKETGSVDTTPVERVKGFHTSMFRIAGIFGFGSMSGEMINRDKDLFDSKVSTLNATYGIRDWKTRNTFVNTGGELDVMLPAFGFAQTGAFSFTGIKFGVRGRYLFTEAYTSIYDDNEDSRDNRDEVFYGTLMRYHTWAAGPVVWFIFSPRSNNFNLLFNLYVIAGQVFGGEIWGAPALRDANVVTTASSSEYSTNFSGYTLRVGWGPHFALNKWFPVTIGVNVYYSYTRLNFEDPVSVYSPAKTVYNNHEWGGEVSLGVHF